LLHGNRGRALVRGEAPARASRSGEMQHQARRSSGTGNLGRSATQPVVRGRSSTLQRAGVALSEPHPVTPPAATPPGVSQSGIVAATAGGGPPESSLSSAPSEATVEAAASSTAAASASLEDPVGLTPASLKHLKRQRDTLHEEKLRLLAEVAALQAQLKEQKEQVVTLEARAREMEARHREDLEAACQREEAQRSRGDELERLNAKLEDALALREAELVRLREALEEQRNLTKEVCEASEQRANASFSRAADARDHEERIRQLQAENQALKQQLARQAKEHEEMAKTVAEAMAAAEKAMAMHASHAKRVEQLKSAKLGEAINQKVELHISVPRVTLTYNNSPPLLVSAAAGLGEGQIRDFLNREVFPHFEPLWVRMDTLDMAPDGSSKRAYCTKMLERLTEAVKTFVVRSQEADDSALTAAATSVQVVKGNASSAAGAGGGGTLASQASGGSSGGQGAGGAAAALGSADRERLLELLRSGDDRALDSKLLQLLEKGGR